MSKWKVLSHKNKPKVSNRLIFLYALDADEKTALYVEKAKDIDVAYMDCMTLWRFVRKDEVDRIGKWYWEVKRGKYYAGHLELTAEDKQSVAVFKALLKR